MRVRSVTSFLKHIALGSVGVSLFTFISFQTHLNLASAIPLYLFLIVVQSLTGDFLSSLVVAALSAGCLDFFFTDPLFSLYMSNPRNVLALIAFTFTSLVITRLVTQVRTEATRSQSQKERLDRLYRLSQELLLLSPEAASGSQFLEPLQRLFGVTAICIFDGEKTEARLIGGSDQLLAEKTRNAYIRGTDIDEAGSKISVRCLRLGAKLRGAIGFQGLQDSSESAGPLTTLTAIFLERTSAFLTASTATAAAQAEVYRSAILDGLAHEFKTPLATILAAAGALREAGPLADAQIEMAETVESEALRLGSLTSRLLRTARLEREDIKPNLELTDLASVIGRIVHQFGDRSPDRQIVLEVPVEVLEVVVDVELLRLAVGQLIENACKYSEIGSKVSIKLERQGAFVVIQVSNDGSSIPPHERQHVFERFYRGADARRTTSGSGLGLYVARKIALALGGSLDLQPMETTADGVTFSLKLPCVKNEVSDEYNQVVAAK